MIIFQSVLSYYRVLFEDGAASKNPDGVKKLLFCSGKIYYDLVKQRAQRKLDDSVAIARVEQVSLIVKLISTSNI